MNKKRSYLIYGIGIGVVVIGLFAAGRLGGGAAGTQTANIGSVLRAGDLAPDFTLTDMAGNSVTLSQFRGQKPVLIEFLAVWCPHCQNQTEENKIISQTYSEEDLAFLAINASLYGRAYSLGSLAPVTAEDLMWYKDKYGVEERLFLDGVEVGGQYGLKNFPTFVLVDSEGKVVWQTAGEVSAEILKAEIEKVLAGKDGAENIPLQ